MFLKEVDLFLRFSPALPCGSAEASGIQSLCTGNTASWEHQFTENEYGLLNGCQEGTIFRQFKSRTDALELKSHPVSG